MPSAAKSLLERFLMSVVWVISVSCGAAWSAAWVFQNRLRFARSSADLDVARDGLGLGPQQIDMQKPVVQHRRSDLDAFGQDEAALELPGGDAAMQIDALGR